LRRESKYTVQADIGCPPSCTQHKPVYLPHFTNLKNVNNQESMWVSDSHWGT
jgi:hypothetical protein